ncbi:hypothetical protein PBI_MOZY_86 [Mycobacterium phage Mozy]|uniref:Uncharacterized protein n=1 Tax=Mycobacterium phage Mozy TaxID=2922213 RepID=G1D4K0_9CAUD|nr:hypothetical protein FGG28_gp086 [Mycobacterium phage Mozy]AEK09700.1 hypothetical protein PBI_MOZY_86 [Mycobacterium phage Mozy]
MSSEAQNVIAEVLRGHEYNGASCGAEYSRHEFCTCGWSGPGESAHEQHQAEEIDRALGRLSRVRRNGVLDRDGVLTSGFGHRPNKQKDYTRWVSGWSEA